MPQVISGLRVDEVSLVARPANQLSKVTLTKREDVIERHNVSKGACRLCESKVESADKFCRNCGAPFFKNEENESMVKTDDEKVAAEQAEADEAAAAAEVAKTDAEIAEAEAVIAKADAELAEIAEAEQAEQTEKSAVDLAKAENDELREKLAKSELREKVLVKSALIDDTMAALPSVKDLDLAKALVSIEAGDSDLAKSMEALLASCSKQLAEGTLLKQVADPNAQDTLKGVDEGVAAIRKARPELTKYEAEAEYWKTHKDEYDAGEDSHRAEIAG